MIDKLTVTSFSEMALLLKREHQRIKGKGNRVTQQDIADLVALLLSAVTILAEHQGEKDLA